jgi:hypothetical protein
MPARGRHLLVRFSCSIALILCAMGGMAVGAGADTTNQALNQAFPAPDWKKGKSPAGLWVDCVAEGCGPPAHLVYTREPANPAMASRIKSGAINREWAEQLAASFRRSQGDEITVLDFAVQTGQVPGWSMLYRCHCDGRTSFVSSQIMLASKGLMTFYSLATTAEAAQQNMQKLMVAVMGESSR